MSELRKIESVTEGDTARETVIRLNVRGRALPVEIESAILRIDGDPVIEIPLELVESGGDEWFFRWTEDVFDELPASGTDYQGKVLVTFDDGSEAYFPTGTNLRIRVYATP